MTCDLDLPRFFADFGEVTTVAIPAPRVADFVALTKPRIVGFIVLTAVAGLWVAPGAPPLAVLLHLVIGTGLVAAGTCALNQVVERDVDGLMHRTVRRPLPAGRIPVATATAFAWLLALTGIAYLYATINVTTAGLAALTLVSYVYLYTPLKRHTSLATLVGALPGALPILGGWTATGAPITIGALALFWTLFLWQLPHFLALAWLYREDYARAGLRMLSVEHADHRVTFRQAALYAAALLPVSLVPAVVGITGTFYFVGAVALGVWLLVASMRAMLTADVARAARRLFLTSVIYLPLLLLLMVLNARP